MDCESAAYPGISMTKRSSNFPRWTGFQAGIVEVDRMEWEEPPAAEDAGRSGKGITHERERNVSGEATSNSVEVCGSCSIANGGASCVHR